MDQSIGFYAPRACFLPPIAELDIVADLLDQATDALLNNNYESARERLQQADMPAVLDYARRIVGREDCDIHRRRQVAVSLPTSGKSETRMPSAPVARSVHARDGWRCRFCGCRAVRREARDRMRALLPGAIPWGEKEGFHAAFYALSATIDHLIPHAAGGANDLDNLVTACWPCNFGRGAYSMEEVGLIDPRSRAPLLDGWDGLGRVLGCARGVPPRAANAQVPADVLNRNRPPTTSLRKLDRKSCADAWFAEINSVRPNLSGRLLALVESCADLGVSCSVNKVMIIRMKLHGINIEQFGVEADGAVHIPWARNGQKEIFRDFAKAIAGAIAGGTAYETPKQWVVKKDGRKVDVLELLNASTAVRAALEELHAALNRSR